MSSPAAANATLGNLGFTDLVGWADDDHAAAFSAFLRSARVMADSPPLAGMLGVSGPALGAIAVKARQQQEALTDRHAARRFFETHFTPMAVLDAGAFLTGYYEPEVAGSLTPDDRFRFPLYRRPPDLIAIDPAQAPTGWDPAMVFGRAVGETITPYLDRPEIMDGALAGQGLELVYLDDPVEAFFIHVQGSATIRLSPEHRMRVAYAAKSGHPYTSIGKRLIERCVATPETMTLAYLRRWLAADPQAADALMRENRSYVFFQALPEELLEPDLGAIAAAGVQITPGRSLAVDHRLHTYGSLIWLEAELPVGEAGGLQPFRRLMVAQDTGSAIVGPARGDIFFGTGADAGLLAGRIRHTPEAFVVLMPKDSLA